MDPRSPLGRHQSRRLGQLRDVGACSDESLAAYLRELGQPCQPCTLTRYREGERAAPLGLLDLVLGHVDDAARAQVLNLWARPHGLRVVADTDLDTDERGLADRVLAATAAVGELAGVVRSALADGELDRRERRQLQQVLERTRGELAELATLLEDQA